MMRRGDVVIIAQKGLYEGKPRPSVVIQKDEMLVDHPSILVCLVTSTVQGGPEAFYKINVEPSSINGLSKSSTVRVDKIATVRRTNIATVVGTLDEKTLGRLNIALALFQGLT
jgi:mRNA interferase MazF